MPILYAQNVNLLKDGPLLEVHCGVPGALEKALVAANKPVPPPVKLLAMIDTGASASVIEAGVLDALDLKPLGVVSVSTPTSHGTLCSQYVARLFLPKGIARDIKLIEAPLQGQIINMLIGRDLLAEGVLIYSGPTNSFNLCF